MKGFLARIYAFKFFEDFVLIYPLYAVMFTKFSIEPWQIAILLMTWSATGFMFEVPSGVWADKYSRKNILFIGQAIRAVGYTVWLVYPSFTGFLAGFILWGIEGALTSGTFQALAYDELKAQNQEKQFAKVLGRTKTASFIAILTASFLASPAIFLGYPFVLTLSSAAVLIAGIIALQIPERKITQSTHEKEYFSLLKDGLTKSLRNRRVLHLIIFLSLTFALGGALDEYWPIFANEAKIPQYGLGIFLGIMSASQGISSLIAHHFENLQDKSFYGLFTLNGILLTVAAYIFNIPSLVILVIFSSLFTIIQTVFESKLQHEIPSKNRATISSVSGFLTEIGALLVYFSFGLISQIGTYRYSFIMFGTAITICGALYLLLAKNQRLLISKSPIARK